MTFISSCFQSVTMASSSLSRYNYDVFLSFRGEDTRKTFVDHLFSALIDRKIHTYKDNVTIHPGESIGESVFKAIEESRIAVIIFSKNYANSSWCLDEVTYIMRCRHERGLIVMPIFYGVDPTDVRKQTGDFGKAFSKQNVEDTIKAELWIKALVDASNICGWEPKNIANGYESEVIKKIIDTIFNTLFPLKSYVEEDLVGMRFRIQNLESRLDMESHGVRMVGIWGVGGGGKTTLATSLFMKISDNFQGHCIMENIREESSKFDLKKLQENMLTTIFKKEVKVQSVTEGKHMIKNMLGCRSVLIVLDDVDNLDQLAALAGSHKWFGNGSRIIITTRDEHLLKTHKVDHVYPVTLLSHDEAIQLFNRHAYNQEDPVEDYETLSLGVISYAAGLPLALKVLGSFLYDKEKKGWMSTLARLKDIPEIEIVEKLKISYDGLKTIEKELFLDIACFFKGKHKDEAVQILDACNFHPEIGIRVLIQKALISIMNGWIYMHDMVQEMGHFIVRAKHPMNPEKHSRVWKREEIKNICLGDATMENKKIEVIQYDDYLYDDDHDRSSRFCKIVSKMKKLRWLKVRMRDEKCDEGPDFLSNELRYIDWVGYPESPFPNSFQPMNLVVLILRDSLQKELWKVCKHLPRLKVLQLKFMKKLLISPDFNGFPCLQKLELFCCNELEEIHPSLGNHKSLEYLSVWNCRKIRMFPSLVHMRNLKNLQIVSCGLEYGRIPCGIGELSNLQELNLSRSYFSELDFSLSQLTRLKRLNLSYCHDLLKLPKLPSSLAILKADYCDLLTTFGDCQKHCKWLCEVSLFGGSIIDDGGSLLQSILKGHAIENGSFLLELRGVEVAKGFRPHVLRGSRCRMQLPENWSNDFVGFIMCVVSKNYIQPMISMKHMMSDTGYQNDVVWEESDNDSDSNEYTWVGYVSFSLIKHTLWWNQLSKALMFNIQDKSCRGFGVGLVAKTSTSGLIETSTNSTRYTPQVKIEQDSVHALVVSITSYDTP